MNSPLFNHALDEVTAFRPEDLVAAVRGQRQAGGGWIPPLVVLEFDGDLTDKLIARGEVRRSLDWPCFHTQMWLWPADEPRCGIVARTIGGPYTVLVAEQMAVCGVKAVVGLASAGRISRELPLPSIVVADEAVRDEGTSLHYLPPGKTVMADVALADALVQALAGINLSGNQGGNPGNSSGEKPEAEVGVSRGLIWTTDAPYRETRSQIDHWAGQGVLAVEMQAASLFAFGQYRGLPTGLVAHVTNGVDHEGEPFHKGPEDLDILLLEAIAGISML